MNFLAKSGDQTLRKILDEFYNKKAERKQHFNDMEENSDYYKWINFYFDSSEVEKRMTAFYYEHKFRKNPDILDILDYTEQAWDRTPFINKVENVRRHVDNDGERMSSIQEGIESYNSEDDVENPLGSFPLNISKWEDLTAEEQEQLADHMLSERPLGGYASFEEIQTAFNKFFPDDNKVIH